MTNPVREIEKLLTKLSSSTTPDPKGGCFCLARDHPLSPHTPSCPSCALPLCTLNAPYHTCPSCSSPLLTTSLISSLQSKLAQTLQNEERQRQRLVEEARKAAGAFPTLSSSSQAKSVTAVNAPVLRPAHETGHKVLSLTSKSKSKSGSRKIVIVSHHTTPTNSGTSTPLPPIEDRPIRVPPPPKTIDHAIKRVDKSRPWKNLMGGDDVKYVHSSH